MCAHIKSVQNASSIGRESQVASNFFQILRFFGRCRQNDEHMTKRPSFGVHVFEWECSMPSIQGINIGNYSRNLDTSTKDEVQIRYCGSPLSFGLFFRRFAKCNAICFKRLSFIFSNASTVIPAHSYALQPVENCYILPPFLSTFLFN